jgi:prolyl oligopeptidase
MLFFIDKTAEQNFGSLVVQVDSQAFHVLLDLESLNSEERTVFVNSYGWTGDFVTYIERAGQSRWGDTRILDVKKKVLLNEKLEGFYSGRSRIAWARDDSGFYYTRYSVPDNRQGLVGRGDVFYHKLNTPQSQDELIYSRPDDPDISYTPRVSADGDYLILGGSYSGGNFLGLEDRLFVKKLSTPGAPVVELYKDVDASFAFEGNLGSRFWIRTNFDAPSLRIIEVNVESPQDPSDWRDLVAESEATIQSVSEIGETLVLRYVKDARMFVHVRDLSGKLINEIDEVAPTFYGFADDKTSSKTFFGVSYFYRPSTIFEYDALSGQRSLYYEPELIHNADNIVTEQVFYSSKDGTQVPMYLVHSKGLERDGSNPVFMYAYGAWAWSAFPWQWHMIPWIEMGGIYAVPGIRGGGEYGEDWYADGARLNKYRGIEDYIAAAEYLVEEGFTSPEIIAANGGSASGVLPAAAVGLRPDLFGASVINFPALDKLRYIQFGSARSWVSEFGDPAIESDFRALRKYSPLHNVREDVCYPPTWIQVGEKDDTTTPMHGYKYAAALQGVQSCSNPVLLKVAWGAGHTYGSTPEQSRRTQAEELAFLVDRFGMTASFK